MNHLSKLYTHLEWMIYICFQQPNTEIQTHLISTQGDSAEIYLGDVPQQKLGKWPQGHLQWRWHPRKPLDPDIFSCWCMEMLLISKVKRPQKTTRNDMNETLGYMKQLRKQHVWFMMILQTWPRVLFLDIYCRKSLYDISICLEPTVK